MTTLDAPAGAGHRRRLLDGLAACIRARGYRDTTVADIVRAARTSRRTFYAQFADRQECLVALLHESNQRTIARITSAVDPAAPWEAQVRQAIEGWIAAVQADPPITLSWIRDVPALGEDRARQLQRETMSNFVALIRRLTDTPQLAAAGVRPAADQTATILLGGLRELIAVTVEEGRDVATITGVAVDATARLLGPR
ncbi:TetR/AcrR family transcriptional regulator [Paractinoplanes hotanensis]|uniref:TetR/AcrR family transcriptional regulator n=1 Tax=Paractinoplanes hotanensis TaxID=2906497 RepID=A0ABT0XXR5_9ACTN|nr:TetR/AcrR family transcriptional regulator [Actinoplanes hotanensis]MCM4078580.1 TetR/AcrR family transcriptional regulator [Actinoplanes hotanensis]